MTGTLVDRLAKVLLYTNTCRMRPTLRTIARGLGCSERQARRYLQALEAAGWPMPPHQAGGAGWHTRFRRGPSNVAADPAPFLLPGRPERTGPRRSTTGALRLATAAQGARSREGT